VRAESAGEGRGSTFTVRLPPLLARQISVPEVVQSIRDQKTDLTELGPDVLIVDDESDAREMLALMLQTRGATVRSVGSAAEAFDAMADRRPDVLLADLGMAVEDGYSLIRRWRRKEKEERRLRVAAIAVTAYANPIDRERALTAGYDWHIAKPVDASELVRVIATVITAKPAPSNCGE
jgi:CheY-like chemotaxis protein